MLGLIFAVALAGGSAPTIPDPSLSPGMADPTPTVAMLCQKGGYTNRPGIRNVSAATKKAVLAEYHYNVAQYGPAEIDHEISLELSGSNDIKNLWAQSYTSTPWNAHRKDALEDRLHAEMCKGNITLIQAQQAIVGDWTRAYVKYFGAPK
jgi:hypothetical protein